MPTPVTFLTWNEKMGYQGT
uniref:Uncharacterized protein n=1 Tax=Rhizophora mucronata TaxID=61149 RepID=A0A2P2PI04_RHIMU